MIGLTYSDILDGVFPYHHFFTIIHLLCNVGCVAFSAAGLSESALISLAMVFNGFVYQWITLYYIVLNSNYCEKLAEYIWKTDDKIKKSLKTLDSLFGLSRDFCERNTKHYDVHLDCFCFALVRYMAKDTELNKLKDISEVWSKLSNIQDSNAILIDVIENILNNTDEIEMKKHNVCEILSAYMVSKICSTSQNLEDNCMQKIFTDLIEEMWELKHVISIIITSNEKEVYEELSNCLQTNLYILAWIFFQYRVIQLSKDMICFTPQKINAKYARKISDIVFLPIAKDPNSIEVAFKIAMSQLEKEFQK